MEARERLAAMLCELDVPGSFSAQRTAPTGDLSIEVRGVGRLRFPVPEKQARQLCAIARPARYGRGEQTLLDRRVRNTWEVPKSRVQIDKRRWANTLLPVLDSLRDKLGLPRGCRLEAALHSMLVYAPGQFFLPHQDSEKHDAMVGSLVVTLPGQFTGGALIVEHGKRRATYRGSKTALSFVAFYSDCRHEVRPVRSGYRIALTYNLLARQDSTAAPDQDPRAMAELARLLEQHFVTGRRLVYLLDHEYTERGLNWARLKGGDATRAALLQGAAARASCDAVLALADVHETWSTMEAGGDDPWYRRRHRWEQDDEEDDDYDYEYAEPDGDDYELDELIEQTVELKCWMEPSGLGARPVSLVVSESEVCASTPSDDLEPYSSEYEGYMGNWGNTLDRWYRRGAIVLWPQAQAFAVRAEAEPAWALGSISGRLRVRELAEARQMAASLAPFWKVTVGTGQPPAAVATALRVAGGLDDPALARMLLEPFEIEALGRAHAAPLAALVERYGERFLSGLIDEAWSGRWAWRRTSPQARFGEWMVALPRLCEALRGRPSGGAAALVLVRGSWNRLRAAVTDALAARAPSHREKALKELAPPLAAALHSAALLDATSLRDEVVGFCQAQPGELVPSLVQTLRAAKGLAPELRRAAGLDVLAGHCAERLATRLACPPRDPDDWSIELTGGCGCELCGVLTEFLADRTARVFEWPLAEQLRRHVHATIDSGELPVLHQTRRRGRPYTLVLTKTDALFEAERRERARDQADAAWLAAAWNRRNRDGGRG